MLCRPRRVEGMKGHTPVMFLSMGAPRFDVIPYYRLISELIYNRYSRVSLFPDSPMEISGMRSWYRLKNWINSLDRFGFEDKRLLWK